MNQSHFNKITLPLNKVSFLELINETEFEDLTKGRMGNHLVKVGDSGIPLVRTTTQYTIAANQFTLKHHNLINCIHGHLNHLPIFQFNHALIEVYSSRYTKMKYHSDQCLDLAPNSYIGLFSSYEKPDELTEHNLRKLKIKDKVSQEEFEIVLTHNSFVWFSVETNSKFSHKIVLETAKNQNGIEENRWLGITFRESKTHIQFKNNLPYLTNGALLELATESQKKEYYKLRGEENRSLDFVYPEINYTLSMADRLKPKP